MGDRRGPARRLPAVDPQNRELLLSIGVFTENLSLAAGGYGDDLQVQVLASKPTDEGNSQSSFKKRAGGCLPLEPDCLPPHGPRRPQAGRSSKKRYIEKLAEESSPQLFLFSAGQRAREVPDRMGHRIPSGTNAIGTKPKRGSPPGSASATRRPRSSRDGLILESMEITGIFRMVGEAIVRAKDVLNGVSPARDRRDGEDAREGGGWRDRDQPGEKVSDLIETGTIPKKCFSGPGSQYCHPFHDRSARRGKMAKRKIPANRMDPRYPPVRSAGGYLDRYPEPVSLPPAGFRL